MSVSTEVQRTLVKSPPELWAELGNPERLAHHLGEVGEIRVTKVEPETRVEWEADLASGFVELKQSGWGTRVTLSLTRELPAAETETPVEPVPPEPAPVAEMAAEPEPVAATEARVEPAPEPQAAVLEPVAATVQPGPGSELEPAPEPLSEPEPQLGFFARLFRKRKAKLATPVESQPEPEPEPVEVEVVAMAAPEPIYPEPPPKPAPDLAAELASVEVQMTEESTELLTGVLDRLGAAHHRPFSRA